MERGDHWFRFVASPSRPTLNKEPWEDGTGTYKPCENIDSGSADTPESKGDF